MKLNRPLSSVSLTAWDIRLYKQPLDAHVMAVNTCAVTSEASKNLAVA